MTRVGQSISELETSLLNQWRINAAEEERNQKIFTDIYDLIISLWNKKIISDSFLAMDILQAYYKYSKYRYVDTNVNPEYYQMEVEAVSKFNELIKLIENL